jgi:uncharacterized membrane protein YhhN
MFNSILPLIFLSAYSHIYCDYLKKDTLCYVLKPLTTVLIIVLAFMQSNTLGPIHYWVFAGLLFSLIGDVFLMFKAHYFIHGLVAFFIAHICYVFGFTDTEGFVFKPWLLIALLVFAGALLLVLNKHLGKLKLPVYGYAFVMVLMVLASYNFFQLSWHYMSLLAFVGALFFMLSDSILAYSKFVKQFYWSQPALLATYYIAQTMIALSLSN